MFSVNMCVCVCVRVRVRVCVCVYGVVVCVDGGSGKVHIYSHLSQWVIFETLSF
jgi:hypothetical protein